MDGVIAELAAHPIANSAVCEAGSLEFSPERVRVCLVPVELVGSVIAEVAHWIRSALASAPLPGEPLDVVMARLEVGRYRLLLAGVGDKCYAGAVLEVREISGESCVFVVAAGGAVSSSLAVVGRELWQGILAYARSFGMAVRFVGRPGWARWCARHGGGVKVRVTRIVLEAR